MRSIRLLLGSNPAFFLSLGLFCTSSGLRWLIGVEAAAEANSDQPGERDGALQVLADGTQDLAALVGLFATDSVERYSFDYTHGYLSVAMATCSMLGILGYVRGLAKLAMGSNMCHNSAFSTRRSPRACAAPLC